MRPGDILATAMRLPEHGEERPERGGLCRLLGYLVGDGTFQKHRAVGFCGSDPAVVEDAIRSLPHFPGVVLASKESLRRLPGRRLLLRLRERLRQATREPLARVAAGDRCVWAEGLARNLSRIGCSRRARSGRGSSLPAILSADGCVKQVAGRGWFVHFDTVSRRLAEDVQMLLLRLGVVATMNDGYQSAKATQPIYRIQVVGFTEQPAALRRASPAGRA